MIKNYLIFTVCAMMIVVLSSCTKEVPPELLKNNNSSPNTTQKQDMPDDSIHRNLKKNSESGNTGGEESWDDEGANKLIQEADAADAAYKKTKSENDKETCVKMQLKAANYLMFDADLPPKDKYKPALQRYRRVLELDPGNQEAMANKQQIEEIYQSMGKPIPN
ncbi:MAG: hypothetical protein WAT71_16570 [Ignavibacteria bacterium]